MAVRNCGSARLSPSDRELPGGILPQPPIAGRVAVVERSNTTGAEAAGQAEVTLGILPQPPIAENTRQEPRIPGIENAAADTAEDFISELYEAFRHLEPHCAIILAQLIARAREQAF